MATTRKSQPKQGRRSEDSRSKGASKQANPNARSGPKQKRQRTPQPRRTSPVMVAAVAVVVVAGIAAIAVSMAAQRREEAGISQTRPVSVTGTSLPPMPGEAGAQDPALGMEIPAIEGQSFDGTPVSISPGGKPKVVIFLAHWCPHCQAEVPRLVQWIRENGIPQEVEVVSVSTGVDAARPNYPPSRWLEREGWTVPVIADDAKGSVFNAFGVQGYPTFVIVSADGKVVRRLSGELTKDQWEAVLSTALMSSSEQARQQ